MITNTAQKWEVGEVVKVGFLTGLTVVEKIPTPRDWAPDQYRLRAANGREYLFTPHKGIERIK